MEIGSHDNTQNLKCWIDLDKQVPLVHSFSERSCSIVYFLHRRHPWEILSNSDFFLEWRNCFLTWWRGRVGGWELVSSATMEVCRKSPAIIVQNQVHFQCQDLPLLQHHSGLNRRGHSWDPCRPACSSHWELFHWTTEPPWGRFQLKNSSWWWLRDIWIYLANIRALDGNYFVAFLLQQGYCLSDCPLTARSWLKKAIPVDS